MKDVYCLQCNLLLPLLWRRSGCGNTFCRNHGKPLTADDVRELPASPVKVNITVNVIAFDWPEFQPV